MNKINKTLLLALLSFSLCGQAMAAFVLNGTRFIYEEGKKNISFEVTNQSERTYGGQVWIDNVDEANGVYMVPSPPFFKIGAKEKQIVRIMKVSDSLPNNRESLFWLNVQEVPQKPKDSDGNVLAIAMDTQVKLIYRPKALIGKRLNAENQIQIVDINGKTYLKNPTPYYFAITGVKENGKEVKLSSAVAESIARFSPMSDVDLGKKLVGKISIDAVNDWGGIQSYDLKK